METSKTIRHRGPTDRQAVWITDAHTVTALDGQLDGLWQKLMAGQSAIKPITHFSTRRYVSTVAAGIDDLTATGDRSNRSRCRALLDLLIDQLGPLPAATHLITATTKSGIDQLERTIHAKPALENEMLLSDMAHHLSKRFKLTDSGLNVSAACASSTMAVALGAARIAANRADAVLICCMDIITEFVYSGFSALKALSPGPCKPFDTHRRGLSLGEGAGALLLMNSQTARSTNRTALGQIIGSGMANDASHITAPAITGAGLARAIDKALQTAGLSPDAIAAISAHGTGTVYNDAMEIKAFRAVFGARRSPLPVYSIKGAIGHSLGAAGGIEVAVGLRALAQGTTPPTVGCKEPETAPGLKIGSGPQPIEGDYMLTTNSGFGGINAAVILARGNEA